MSKFPSLKELTSHRKETNDIHSHIKDPDEYDVEKSDFHSNKGYVYPHPAVHPDFPPYIEKVKHGFFTHDGSDKGNVYPSLSHAEKAMHAFHKGESGLGEEEHPQIGRYAQQISEDVKKNK